MSAAHKQEGECPVGAVSADAVLTILKRWQWRELNDDGPLWHGIGRVRQALGMADKEAVRGVLIELVARGEVEVSECSSGVSWRAHYTPAPPVVEAVDGHFILQRQIMDDHRGLWFDAETFTNSARAQQALKFAKAAAQHAARDGALRGDHRVQSIRLLSAVRP